MTPPTQYSPQPAATALAPTAEPAWLTGLAPQYAMLDWHNENDLIRLLGPEALKAGRTLHTRMRRGQAGAAPAISAFLEREGYRLFLRRVPKPARNVSLAYARADGIVYIDTVGDSVDVTSATLCAGFAEAFGACLEVAFQPARDEIRVWVLQSDGGDTSLSSLGLLHVEWRPGNYAPDVASALDAIAPELSARNPAGRLVLLDGEPGTGKTHFLRALMQRVPDAYFVVVPPSLVSSLAGPTLVGSLKKVASEGRPIILVLEDADECLAPRQADNAGSISALLNLSDGLLGNLLNIRIVASTNQKLEEIDAALLRPGRLLRHVRFERLSFEQASKVLQDLNPSVFGRLVPGTACTLGELYQLARAEEFCPSNFGSRLGFRPQTVLSGGDHA